MEFATPSLADGDRLTYKKRIRKALSAPLGFYHTMNTWFTYGF